MNTINFIKIPYGNYKYIASNSYNINQIVSTILQLYQLNNINQHFIIKFNKYLDDIYNNYNIIPVNKEHWTKEYITPDVIAYINIKKGKNNTYYIFGRIKSNNSYWIINKVI